MLNANRPLYRILDISPKSNWLIFFCIPPLYFIYFFAVGNYLLEKSGKKNQLFQIVIWTVVISFCSLPFIDFHRYQHMLTSVERTFIASAILSYFLSLILLAVITVNYERSLKADHHFTFSDNFDYVKRFFVFGYFPFTIWAFQRLANAYRKPTA
jgi:hypothetical protein